ncbi:MAG TPA: hypothetical protein VGM88_04635 [Kofleriaceae bacterium]|jgi:hypothetical protein
MRVLWLLPLAACGRIGFGEQRQCASDGCVASLTVPDRTMLPGTSAVLAVTGGDAATWAAPGGGSIAGNVFRADTAGDYPVVVTTTTGATATGTVHVTSIVTPSVIAHTGDTTAPSGFASEHHGAWVPSANEWWIWYGSRLDASDAQMLFAAHSASFDGWTQATSLPATQVGGDGRNLDVAVASLGGHAIVHATYGNEGRNRYHVRGEIAGGDIAWGAPELVNSGGNEDPDGPSTVVTAGGRVIDATGWQATPATPPLTPCGDGDNDLFIADGADTGTTSFDAMTYTEQVIWCVPTRINNRRLLAIGETVFELYDDGGSDPDPQNLFFNVRAPDGTWAPDETTYTPPPSVFSTDRDFRLDDWSATIQGGRIHAIRRVDGTPQFEHRMYDPATASWADGPAIADGNAKSGNGVVVLPYGSNGVIALELRDNDAGVEYAYWDAATGWTAWQPLDTGAASGYAFIAGIEGAGDDKRPAVIWTQDAALVRGLEGSGSGGPDAMGSGSGSGADAPIDACECPPPDAPPGPGADLVGFELP